MKERTKKILGWIGGGVVGFVSGFFGGGGGMICVPLLQKGMRQNAKVSHATAMPVILPVSVFSAITYAIEGFFDFPATLWTGIGAVLGGIIGALLLKKLESGAVRIIFAVIMLAAGVKMIL